MSDTPDMPVAPTEPGREIRSFFLSPAWMEAYERTAPGTAKKIVDAFVKECDHRRAMEGIMVRAQARSRWTGQLAALTVTLLFAGIAMWGMATDRPVRGVVTLLAPLAVLVNTILLGWRRRGDGSAAAPTGVTDRPGIRSNSDRTAPGLPTGPPPGAP